MKPIIGINMPFKKLFFTIFLLLLSTFGVRAQRLQNPLEVMDNSDLSLLEFEFGTGINIARPWDGVKARVGTNFLLELRLNRPAPYDFGLQLQMNSFTHEVPNEYKVNSTCIRPLFYFDYNYRVDRFTSFFAGVGIGGSFVQRQRSAFLTSYKGLLSSDFVNTPVIAPRVGVVLMGGLRFTAGYIFTGDRLSCFSLNLGFVMGGKSQKVH
ncbi:MAG: hypothetical protein LBM20_05500 [Rikenellaceae bacterium]|nr:hypothetical protein [Rikenellaceae bacterium]